MTTPTHPLADVLGVRQRFLAPVAPPIDVIPFLEVTPETGEKLAAMKGVGYADVAQDTTGVPGPRPQGFVNYPEQNMGSLEIQEAIRTLARANIPVPLPGELEPAPFVEWDQDYENLNEANKTFLRVLEKTGRVTKAAEIAGKSRTCFNNRKKRDPVFAKLWKRALSQRAEMIEDEAIRRAVQGVNKNIYYMGAVCGQEKVYSDTLLNKLLEGNMPEKYRQNHKIELEGKMAVATLVLPATTSAEEWAEQNSGTIIDHEPEDEYA